MESFAPHHETYWLVQPLLEARLPLEEIEDLVCRLGFEAVVCDGRTFDTRAGELVSDRPAEIRAAWVETIDRMIGSARTDPAPGAPPVRPAPAA